MEITPPVAPELHNVRRRGGPSAQNVSTPSQERTSAAAVPGLEGLSASLSVPRQELRRRSLGQLCFALSVAARSALTLAIGGLGGILLKVGFDPVPFTVRVSLNYTDLKNITTATLDCVVTETAKICSGLKHEYSWTHIAASVALC